MKILCVFGTRPEAIKMAPLVKRIEADGRHQCVVVVTAQHREMLDQVLELFEIVPDHDLNIMQPGQSLEEITSRALMGLSRVFRQESPDLVLVHGDTTTTFAGALAAFYDQVPVGHVEAGLRTGKRYSPFPEEINRKLTTSLTELHLAPTERARENLLAEGVNSRDIFVTGNTVIDALMMTLGKPYDLSTIAGLEKLDPDRKVILLTSHRRENLGEKMDNIFRAVRDVATRFSDQVQVVFPVHLNPRVRETVHWHLRDVDNVLLTDPLEYQPFVALMNRSHLILTDSGGIQEEAPSLGKPVLVLRDTTERPEALEAGTVTLCGTDYQAVYDATCELLTDPEKYKAMAEAANPYGDGRASERIVDIINERYRR